MSVLVVSKRETTTQGQLKQQRSEKLIPAVIYGLKKDPLSLKITEAEFRKYLKLKNRNIVLELDIDGQKESVIVREFVYHPITKGQVLHIDFLRVDDKTPVTVKVPIEHYGVPFGVKNQGGQFKVMKRFVKLSCLVADIPELFQQDISELKAEEVFYVRDLKFEKGTVLTPEKVALYGVSKAKGAKEEDVAPAVAEKRRSFNRRKSRIAFITP